LARNPSISSHSKEKRTRKKVVVVKTKDEKDNKTKKIGWMVRYYTSFNRLNGAYICSK
jgi:hypothetical protein